MTQIQNPQLAARNPKDQPPPIEFPADALPPVMRALLIEMQRTIKAPMAICGASLLTMMSLAAQSLADVRLPSIGRTVLSLFFLTIAKSGERKSAADKVARAPVDAVEAIRYQRDGKQEAKPLSVNDITIEGIDSLFESGVTSLALCNDEGGQVTNSRNIADQGKVAFLTGLSKAWDGSPRKRLRKGDGLWTMMGKRLSCHLMLQPILATSLLDDPLWSGQGTLARFLISSPESTIGTRTLADWSKAGLKARAAFEDRVTWLLDLPQPVSAHDASVLEPPALELTTGAAKVWSDFYHEVESQIGPGGSLEPIQAFGCKAAEQAGRIAGCFAVFEVGPHTKVTQAQMLRAIRLTRYYLEEALRLKAAAHITRSRDLIELLDEWLERHSDREISIAEMQQKGPAPLRKKATLDPVVKAHEESGRLVKIEGGCVRDGKLRKDAYRIVSRQAANAA